MKKQIRKFISRFRAFVPLIFTGLFISLMTATSLKAESSLQKHVVTGTVTSAEDGIGLPGVTINVKGTSVGTIANLYGEYSLEVGSPDVTLVFSYVGFVRQEIQVNGKLVIDVQMQLDAQTFDELVVVGYGTQKKVNLSGAVDVISSKVIENRPVSNVSQALQGMAPNLNITVGNDGGEVGGKMLMNIRGIGSINGDGGSPYILVDGMEQDLYKINPADIESISVLKDAAASAIYGARAAFGVILVTTKKGRTDGVSVEYSNNYSFSAPTIVPHIPNSIEFAKYFNHASINSGAPAQFVPAIMEYMQQYQDGEIDHWTMPHPLNQQVWLSYNGGWANTDWYKESYKEWVPNNTHNVSISGGDERTQFYISGSTFNQEGLLVYGEDEHRRNTISAKVNTKINDWMRFNFSSKLSRTNISRPSYDKGDFYYNLARQWPTNAPYYPDGNLAGEAVQIWLERGGRYNENQNEYTLAPGLEIEPVKNWTIFANYRWKMNPAGRTIHEAKVFGTDAYSDPHPLRNTNSFESTSFQSTYNSPNIYSTYTKEFGSHRFTIMAGFEQELYTDNWTFGKRYDLISDELPSLPTATGIQENNGGASHFSTRSYFGRLNYSIQDKYLFEFSGRYDGSSKFPTNYRWGLFPSGSAAYIISKEEFWEPLENVVNMFKVRASYGALGNQNVDNYLSVERLPLSDERLGYIFADGRPNFVTMGGLVSPGITWEKVNTSNIGMDAGFLNNRLSISFDYFIRNTFDMLGQIAKYPSVLGISPPRSNNASLQTKGFEFVTEWRDMIGEFSYSAKFMISDAISTITQYHNPEYLLSDTYYEGMRYGDIWGYTTVGLFESDAQAQDPSIDQSYISSVPWRAGDVHYADLNDDGKIDIGENTLENHGDLSIIGNSAPRYNFSAIFSTQWKGFDFTMLWQGVGKRDLALGGSLFWGVIGNKWWNIGLEEHMDYWNEENTDAYYPRPYFENWEGKNHQTQTRYLQSGAYLRLKSVQLGYNLPTLLTQKVQIKNLRVYVSGENLLTFTNLIGIFDPEGTGGSRGNGLMYPLQKVVSAGLNVTF